MPPNTAQNKLSDTVYHTSSYSTIHNNPDDTVILQRSI